MLDSLAQSSKRTEKDRKKKNAERQNVGKKKKEKTPGAGDDTPTERVSSCRLTDYVQMLTKGETKEKTLPKRRGPTEVWKRKQKRKDL